MGCKIGLGGEGYIYLWEQASGFSSARMERREVANSFQLWVSLGEAGIAFAASL